MGVICRALGCRALAEGFFEQGLDPLPVFGGVGVEEGVVLGI